jgi:hypothetical protein
VLPEECILHALSYLSERDLATVALLNRQFKRLAEDDAIWRLLAMRYLSPPPSSLYSLSFSPFSFSFSFPFSLFSSHYSQVNPSPPPQNSPNPP